MNSDKYSGDFGFKFKKYSKSEAIACLNNLSSLKEFLRKWSNLSLSSNKLYKKHYKKINLNERKVITTKIKIDTKYLNISDCGDFFVVDESATTFTKMATDSITHNRQTSTHSR